MDDQGRPQRAGRRPRVQAADVRARMLKTAAQIVFDSGLGVSLDALSMEDVIQVARVPRSSVYRLWPYKDRFIDELLTHLAGPDGFLGAQGVFNQATFAIVHQVIEDNSHRLSTLAGRRELLYEVVRLGAGENFRASLSPQMRMHSALMAAVASRNALSSRGDIAAAVEAAAARSRQNIIDLLTYVMNELGFRMRDKAWTLAHLQAAGAALMQGLAMRYDTALAAKDHWQASHPGEYPPDQVVVEPILGPGLDGQPAEWTLAAWVYLGVVDHFIEPDPAFRSARELASLT